MKKALYLLSIFFILQISFTACKQADKNKRPVMEKVEINGVEYNSKYICPMHCKGSGSDKPGVCPVCGMDYELNETHNHENPQKTK